MLAKSCRRNAQFHVRRAQQLTFTSAHRGIVSSYQQEMLKYMNDTDVGLRLITECRTLRANLFSL